MVVLDRWSQVALALAVTQAVFARWTLAADGPPSPTVPPVPTPASAAVDPWRNRTSTLCGNLGLGSAVGEAGLTYAYVPWMPLQTEIGVGIGVTGQQYSLMEKVAIGRGRMRFVPGFGTAYSPHHLAFWKPQGSHWWLNLDLLAFETRTQSGHAITFAIGWTFVLGKPVNILGDACGDCTGGSSFPQLRLGVGRWF